ncbi:MAG: class I SAM-dependent methyltransferase [Candidatus Omnitrophica bacterium]|nr:class I SAM-dependent methyltransferase [Candidatus Omnitrophota bacterium]
MKNDIKKYFAENISDYLKQEKERKELARNSLLTEALKDYMAPMRGRTELNILEVGGASGVLLKDLVDLGATPVVAWNLEIVEEYRNYLVDKRIRFINASIFGNSLTTGYFDFVICRYGLHHFVGDTVSKTIESQKEALREMARLVKPGGILVIEEELMERDYASFCLYFLSRLFARFGLQLKRFGINRGVMVFFHTKKGIFGLLDKQNIKYSIIEEIYPKVRAGFVNRALFLFQKSYPGIFIFRIDK